VGKAAAVCGGGAAGAAAERPQLLLPRLLLGGIGERLPGSWRFSPHGNELSPWQTGRGGLAAPSCSKRNPKGSIKLGGCSAGGPPRAETILAALAGSRTPRPLVIVNCRLRDRECLGSACLALTVSGRPAAAGFPFEVLVEMASDRAICLPLAGRAVPAGWEAPARNGMNQLPRCARDWSGSHFFQRLTAAIPHLGGDGPAGEAAARRAAAGGALEQAAATSVGATITKRALLAVR